MSTSRERFAALVASPDCDLGLAALEIAKSADPADGTPVAPGTTLTYRITLVNEGTGAAVVDQTDHLGGVLDDATLDVGSLVVTPAGSGLTAFRDSSGSTVTAVQRSPSSRSVRPTFAKCSGSPSKTGSSTPS